MSKNTIIGSVLAVGVPFIIFLAYQAKHLEVIVSRFPEIDPKVVRKAYAIFYKRAADGAYGDMTDFSEAQMDQMFLLVVDEVNSN